MHLPTSVFSARWRCTDQDRTQLAAPAPAAAAQAPRHKRNHLEREEAWMKARELQLCRDRTALEHKKNRAMLADSAAAELEV